MGAEDKHYCGESGTVLESDPIKVYGLAGERILLLPKDRNGSELHWKVDTSEAQKFLRRIYRRLYITDVTAFAAANHSVWYDLKRNGETVYTSNRATVAVGSKKRSVVPICMLLLVCNWRACNANKSLNCIVLIPIPAACLHLSTDALFYMR
jgi:hypothetical protein